MTKKSVKRVNSRKHLVILSLCILFLTTLVFVLLNSSVGPNKKWTGESFEENGLVKTNKLLNASSNHVFFMHHKDQDMEDIVSARTVMNMCEYPQIERYYMLNDTWVDSQGCPRLDKISSGEHIVLVGGPNSQPCTKYYEETGQAPLIFKCNSTHVWWKTVKNQTVGVTLRLQLDEYHDVFVMQFFVDHHGRKIFMSYGYSWKGTRVSALYLSATYKEISTNNQSYYIFDWVGRSNDGLPTAGEVMDEQQKFVCIQAAVDGANLTRIEWFGNLCHSQGLELTWYVDMDAMEEDQIINRLVSFALSGDQIELSFGQTFFNKMEPLERLKYVDRCMDVFQSKFNRYPSIVECYYIDSYTLNYMSNRYPMVKAAIAYVNHETECDEFKSAGAYYMPYYPSKRNTLVPGDSQNKIDIVVLPFLHRDLTNCILKDDINYNLDPQDGFKVVKNWTTYFRNLFEAYMEGWDLFGLALYFIDLAYAYLPIQLVEHDIDYIQSQVQSGRCFNVLDTEFVVWFRSEYQESPSYQWVYQDPENSSFLCKWRFTQESRTGYVNGEIFEFRVYLNDQLEECFDKIVWSYDNSAPP